MQPPTVLMEPDEQALIAAVQRGDQGAFAVLVGQRHGRCFALAWRITQDRMEAEDVVQEAFLKVWRGAKAYDPQRGVFGAWLNRIVTNCALDRRRSLKNVTDLADAATVADDRPDAERLAQSADVHRMMATMPPRQRAALALFYLEGYSMNEVAEMMDSNMKSVESLLSRGRAALRDLLQPAPSEALS